MFGRPTVLPQTHSAIVEGDYFKILSQASSISYRSGKLMSASDFTEKIEGIMWKPPNIPTSHLQFLPS